MACNGAFYRTSSTAGVLTNADSGTHNNIAFDASFSNSIYKNDFNKVLPKSIAICIYIKY